MTYQTLNVPFNIAVFNLTDCAKKGFFPTKFLNIKTSIFSLNCSVQNILKIKISIINLCHGHISVKMHVCH